MFRTIASSALVAGTILVASVGVASAAGKPAAHPGVRAAYGAGVVAARHRPLLHRLRIARPGTLLKVTAVNGTTISAVNRANVPFTVTVSTSTTVVEAGSPVAATTIAPDLFIRVRGTRPAAHTIAARSIVIVVPMRAGRVTAINGTSFTLTAAFGKTFTVQTSSSTRYVKAGHPKQASAFTAIAVGTRVAVQGTLSADKTTISALRIAVGATVAPAAGSL